MQRLARKAAPTPWAQFEKAVLESIYQQQPIQIAEQGCSIEYGNGRIGHCHFDWP